MQLHWRKKLTVMDTYGLAIGFLKLGMEDSSIWDTGINISN